MQTPAQGGNFQQQTGGWRRAELRGTSAVGPVRGLFSLATSCGASQGFFFVVAGNVMTASQRAYTGQWAARSSSVCVCVSEGRITGLSRLSVKAGNTQWKTLPDITRRFTEVNGYLHLALALKLRLYVLSP